MKKFFPLLLCLLLASCGTQSKTDLALEDTRANDDISDRPELGTATAADSILAVNAGNAAGSRLSRILLSGDDKLLNGTGGWTLAPTPTTLGLVIGTNVQAYDADLADLADGSLTGTKVGFADTDNLFTATNVDSALSELNDSINAGVPNGTGAKVHWSQLLGVPAGFADGTDDGGAGTDDQIASEVPFTPNGSIVATNVQAAIQEVRDEAGSGHTAASINAAANGLSIDGSQVITLGLSSGSTTGALSSTDWTTFNGKQAALTAPIVAAGAQTITGAKTFDPSMLLVKGSSTGVTAFASANAGASNYVATLQAATGTVAYTADIVAAPTDATISTTDVTTSNASTTKHGWLLKATAPASGLRNLVGIDNAETVYTNKALFDATVPSTQDSADAAVVGTAMTAARRDHKHAMPTIPAAASDTAYDATTWDGVTTVPPSKNAIRDKLESISSSGADGQWGISTKNNTSTFAPQSGYDSGFAVVGNIPQAYYSAGLHPLVVGTSGVAAGNVLVGPTDPAAHTLFGFDNTTNTYRTILIGANLSYNQATNTMSASASSGMTNPMTTVGDLIVGSTAGDPARVGDVAVGQVLASGGVGAAPSYSASPQVTTVELGHATDTTLARGAAGRTTVEGFYLPRIAASGSVSFDPASVADGACSSATDGGTATGVATTDNIDWSFSGTPIAVTGYNPSGNLGYIIAYPTADHVNFIFCNKSGSAIDAGAVTLNWMVLRP